MKRPRLVGDATTDVEARFVVASKGDFIESRGSLVLLSAVALRETFEFVDVVFRFDDTFDDKTGRGVADDLFVDEMRERL